MRQTDREELAKHYLAAVYAGPYGNEVRLVYRAPQGCRTRASLEELAIPVAFLWAGTWFLWDPDGDGRRRKAQGMVRADLWAMDLDWVPTAPEGPALLPTMLDFLTKELTREEGVG